MRVATTAMVMTVVVALAMLATAAPGWATTYYVAAAGSDLNSGTDSAHAWQTISKINGATFSAGDSILLNRGDSWYGTSLTVPSSGAAGSPITFGAYGSGANPVIKGSTKLAMGSFTLAPNTSATIFARPDSGASSTDSATRNWRQQIGHADITASATTITISVTASPTAALNITGAGIGAAATAPNAGSITRITWDGGNNGATVAAGTTKTSDQILYSLSNASDQIVTIYTTARNVEYYNNNAETLWSNFSAPDQSQSASVTGYTSGGNTVVANITAIQTTQYTFRNALGTAPVAVWENGSLMKLATSPATTEQIANSWYYDGTYLYLHASDGSNVSSNGKTYSDVTASSPSFTAFDNGKSYLIFDAIDQAETYNTSTATLGGLYLTGSNNIVRNLSAHDTYRHALTIYIGAHNNTVTNITAFNTYGTSPLAVYGAGTTGNLIQYSTLHNDTSLKSAYVATGVWGVVVFHGASTNNTIDSCILYSTAATPGGYGVLEGDSGTTATVSHTLIYGSFAYAVAGGGAGGSGLGTGSSITLWSDLIDISASNNAGMTFAGSAGNAIYNNTIYGPGNANAALSLASSSTGALVKNNIFWTGGYISADASSETGSAMDYNDYFSASGTPFSWGGTAYNFSNWKTNSSQDAHALNSDPKLVNGAALTGALPGGGDYSLQAGSPAIDAGVNLGTTYQFGLAPWSAWTFGVPLVNQNLYGAGWEMGAYAFGVGRSTLTMRGCCD